MIVYIVRRLDEVEGTNCYHSYEEVTDDVIEKAFMKKNKALEYIHNRVREITSEKIVMKADEEYAEIDEEYISADSASVILEDNYSYLDNDAKLCRVKYILDHIEVES